MRAPDAGTPQGEPQRATTREMPGKRVPTQRNWHRSIGLMLAEFVFCERNYEVSRIYDGRRKIKKVAKFDL
jgi:hypothetical protein